MPNLPYKSEKPQEDNEDYEIVSFEDFCDKSPGSKTDLLTLNDNINYRLCYESDKASKYLDADGDPSQKSTEHQTETSLSGSRNATSKKKSSFAPFGRHNSKVGRGPLFSGVVPKARNEEESASREHRYERFSDTSGVFSRLWGRLCCVGRLGCVWGAGSGVWGVGLTCVLCVVVWWAVGGAVGGQWGEDHYKKLWERAHPDTIKKPLSPMPSEKYILPEHRYHDHNNLSTKNKNTSELRRGNKKAQPLDPGESCAGVPDVDRFDCLPQRGASEAGCKKRGCCWSPATTKGAPFCYFPPNYQLYRFANMTENKHGLTVNYDIVNSAGYPGEFAPTVHFYYLSETVLQIKIIDACNKRFEVPYPETWRSPAAASRRAYRVRVGGAGAGFRVTRAQDNVTIMDTTFAGAMILADKFLQLSTLLPTDRVFGIGERRGSLLVDMDWKTYTLFNRDRVPVDNANLYGTHPFHLGVEKDGKSHGMLLLNSNAMDIAVQPTPALTYRTVGGVINLFLLLGDAPGDVVAQLTRVVGRPALPPYWALGFHLCKYNQTNVNVTRNVWKTNREANIPFDVQWNDIDYMERRNGFTLDEKNFGKLPQLVQEIHDAGMHYVILIDPGVGASEAPGTYEAYERGLQMDVFIKNSSNQPFVGKVWNDGSTVWPDFTHPNSSSYWLEMMTKFHKILPYDGAWIDMNEPSNFVSGSLYGECEPENLPYTPLAITDGLKEKTLCMDARHYLGKHYDWHNLYAYTEAVATNFALSQIRGLRALVISRASWPGAARLAGHWSGDVRSTWEDMRASIPEILSFSLFGMPLMGADICGFNGDTSRRLCARWSQLGAFYPFARNHNSDRSLPQDPVSLGPEVVAAARGSLRARYRLLPALYTQFWRAHVYGDTVATPVFFQAPHVRDLQTIDTHFFLGGSLLVSPSLTPAPRAPTIFSRLPREKWYSLSGLSVENEKFVSDNDSVAIKGGSILAVQEPPASGPVTTTVCRSSPFQLLVAPSLHGDAKGELYWDDGDSLNTYEEKKYSHIEFHSNSTELISTITWWGHGVPAVNEVQVFGQPPISSVTINGKTTKYMYNPKTQVLFISNINLSFEKPFTVKWTRKPM